MADEPRDLTAGLSETDLSDGTIIGGRVGDENAILVRRGDKLFAIGAKCTHYGGPLSEGLVVGDTVRCPWHHACFSLTTGEAVSAPALDPVSCWRVERVGGRVFVRDKIEAAARRSNGGGASAPNSVVIIGGGAAGLAAADMLRREGYDRPISIFSAETAPPPDRPNLSKDYLAGTAQADWIPLRSDDFYRDQQIALRIGTPVGAIDVRAHEVRLINGEAHPFGALLIATGAEPIRLNVPGSDLPHVHYLRTQADSDAIVRGAAESKRVAVIGASFIGLEVAASLRSRNLEVHVIGPDRVPMERVLGPEVGQWVRRMHESHGVVFHLERTVTAIERQQITLSDKSTLDVDMIVIGIGVKPRLDLAERAGITIDRGISVNEYLETTAPGIFAAGDIARWPDPHTGSRIRVEHWVVAERQGQAAARNMLGRRQPFDSVPFFWSQHYDTPVNYVGHAEAWDRAEVDGSLDAGDCGISYYKGRDRLAFASIGRDKQNLEVEAEFEGAAVKASHG